MACVLVTLLRTSTIPQPWAELIIAGQKDVENRLWSTAHRSSLAIHAGRTVVRLCEKGLDTSESYLALASASCSPWTSSAVMPASALN